MADLLSAGRRPRLADFGGLDGVVAEAAALCGSPFAPDFLAVVLDGADREDAAARTFVSALAAHPRDDLALNGMVDAIAERAPLADDAERTCFASWLAIARDRERPPSLRTAALRGALLMKGTDPRRGARLAGEIAAIEPDDEASYIAHAARIGGLLHAEAPSPGVTAFLEDAARVDGAADEASFELGMIDVREIFAAADPVSARERIRIARVRFERAISERGARSDAHVLSLSLGLLADFEEGHPAGLRGACARSSGRRSPMRSTRPTKTASCREPGRRRSQLGPSWRFVSGHLRTAWRSPPGTRPVGSSKRSFWRSTRRAAPSSGWARTGGSNGWCGPGSNAPSAPQQGNSTISGGGLPVPARPGSGMRRGD